MISRLGAARRRRRVPPEIEVIVRGVSRRRVDVPYVRIINEFKEVAARNLPESLAVKRGNCFVLFPRKRFKEKFYGRFETSTSYTAIK